MIIVAYTGIRKLTAGRKEAEPRTRTRLLRGKNAKAEAKVKAAAEADGGTTAIGPHKLGKTLDHTHDPIHGQDHCQDQSHPSAVSHHLELGIVQTNHLVAVVRYGW